MSERIKLSEGVRIAFETPDDAAHFYGYYDRCPFDKAGKRILTHRVPFDGRDVTASDSAEIGFYELETGRYTALATTRAFNWQQGSHLQWLPPDYSSRVIFNDRREDRFVSILLNLENGHEKVIPFPIYIVHPEGRFALAANYERLYFCRPGYNYPGIVNPQWDTPIHPDDGIFHVDLDDGTTRPIVRTLDIARRNPPKDIERLNNWLEHFWWNPSGSRFLFMHRWSNGNRHATRIYTANADGTEIRDFPDTRFYSHAGWRTDERFVIWAAEKRLAQRMSSVMKQSPALVSAVRGARRLLRSIHSRSPDAASFVQAGSGPHNKFIEFSSDGRQLRSLPKDTLGADGHCSWTRDGRVMLTDTYEDARSFRSVFLYDDGRGSRHEIGSLFSSYNATTFRCDLHPRFNHAEDMVSVDSSHGELRQQVILDVSGLMENIGRGKR